MEYFTAEYSAKQDCFHVSTLSHVLSINRKNALKKLSNDYEIIGITTSDDEALKVCRDFREKQNQLLRDQRYEDQEYEGYTEEVL